MKKKKKKDVAPPETLISQESMKYLGQSYSQISGTAATSAPEMPLQIFFFKTQNRLRSYYLLEGDYSNVSDS